MPGLNPTQIIFSVFGFLLAISIHEFAHGYIAYKLGDPTAKLYGRLTLNPFAHFDLWGGLMLVLSGFRFGWAKPVPVNTRYFRDPRRGMMQVGLAGPLANFLLAAVIAIPLRIDAFKPFFFETTFGSATFGFLFFLASVNIGLGVFNLIPFPPLDGSRILMGLLPRRYAYSYAQIEAYAPFILMFLILSGGLSTLVVPLFALMRRVIIGF